MSRVFALDALPIDDLENARSLVGGKAANLARMIRELGLPVPPGFVITTPTCREYLAGGWPDGLDAEIRDAMGRLQAVVGRRFGDAADPLLVSVRSGAPVSMPGMMDTILNVGLTPGAVANGDVPFTASCRQRLESTYRATVGADVPEDPWAQLRGAVEAVFRSWNSDRAKAYRAREAIPDDLGTAVTVQAMVFGNRGADSATGVAFTRNPATGAPALYGDVLFDAQGEDVVAGTHATEPIAVLGERLPAVGAQLREYAARLEHHFADLCDIEFTIEAGRLWMLQARVGKRSPQAALRIAVDMADDPDFPLSREAAVRRVAGILAHPPTTSVRSGLILPLATGLSASPGLASGPIVTDPEAAQAVADAGTPAILVRAETSPDDVHGMARAAGVLTSKGGLASHAAVVARGWGIPAVVGASALQVSDGRVAVGERTLHAGDVITIDGSTGDVFEGRIPWTTEVVPEARTLLAWARDLGIEIVAAARPAPAASHAELAREPAATPKATPDDCLHVIGLKGFAPVAGLADALLTTPDDLQPMVDQLVRDGLVGSSAGACRLTEAGTARVAGLVAAERAAWGIDAAVGALDAFLALDARMKETVTAWQLRDPAAQVINDHSDADYDRGVLHRLAALDADAAAWLMPLETGCPRLGGYRLRLARAIERALAGDHRFLASPRVDSYHGVWFELHEDLIQLAGRTRESEVAAGRA
jgi:pyruvate,orthophosphate dikinase